MKFPNTFTKENKIKFYKDRSKALHSKLNKAKDKDKLYAKILDEILICHEEVSKLQS